MVSGTMLPDPELNGQTFSAERCNEHGCRRISFKFKKAYLGSYSLGPWYLNQKVVGAYVDILFKEEGGCRHDFVALLQVTRDYGVWGSSVPPKDYTTTRYYRGGWDNPQSAPSLGWRIDVQDGDADPYYFYCATLVSVGPGGGFGPGRGRAGGNLPVALYQ
jgi:hypothetical protein